jgi:hypothetical protein
MLMADFSFALGSQKQFFHDVPFGDIVFVSSVLKRRIRPHYLGGYTEVHGDALPSLKVIY